MEDYRLEQQKNTAAQILTRAPVLNLYAHKHSLPPAIARFRLLQVLSQSPDEADPTLAFTSAEQQPAVQPIAAQAAGGHQPQPEAQPAEHAAVEPDQGPQPRLAPYALDEAAERPLVSSSDSGTDIDWPSDLEADSEDGVIEQQPRVRAAAAEQEQQQQEHQQAAAAEEPQQEEEELDAELLPDAQ